MDKQAERCDVLLGPGQLHHHCSQLQLYPPTRTSQGLGYLLRLSSEHLGHTYIPVPTIFSASLGPQKHSAWTNYAQGRTQVG